MTSLVPESNLPIRDPNAAFALALQQSGPRPAISDPRVAFGSVLSTQHQLLSNQLHGDEKTSANLMFEPAHEEVQRAESQPSQAENADPNRIPRTRSESKATRNNRNTRNAGERNGVNTIGESGASATRTPATANLNAPGSSLSPSASDAMTLTEASPELNRGDESTPPARPVQVSNSSVARDRGASASDSSAPSEQTEGTNRGVDAGRSGQVNQATEVRENTESESETSPARQVGRILSAPDAGELKVNVSEARGASSSEARSGRHTEAKQSPAQLEQDATASASKRSSSSDAAEPTPFDQLVKSLRLRVGAKVSSAVMQLHPPQLGRMKIDVRVKGDQIRVAVETESQTARDRVTERAGELRAALAQHGISIGQFDVSIIPPPDRADAHLAQGWGKSGDAERRATERRANEERDKEAASSFAASEIRNLAVGTTRLDVRV